MLQILPRKTICDTKLWAASGSFLRVGGQHNKKNTYAILGMKCSNLHFSEGRFASKGIRSIYMFSFTQTSFRSYRHGGLDSRNPFAPPLGKECPTSVLVAIHVFQRTEKNNDNEYQVCDLFGELLSIAVGSAYRS